MVLTRQMFVESLADNAFGIWHIHRSLQTVTNPKEGPKVIITHSVQNRLAFLKSCEI